MCQQEVKSLKEYIQALQVQNTSKSYEQSILHRELEALKIQLSTTEQYYYEVKNLRQEIIFLKEELERKNILCQDLLQKAQGVNENNELMEEWEEHFNTQQKDMEDLRLQLNMSLEREDNLKEIVKMQKTMQLEQKNYNQDLRQILETKEKELIQLQDKLEKVDKMSQKSTSLCGQEIQTLVSNYQRLEELSQQREEKMKEMEKYIDQLEYYCESNNNVVKAKDIEIKQLKKQMNRPQKRQRQKSAYFSRSQIATPQLNDKSQRNSSTSDRFAFKKQKQNSSFILNAPSEQLDKSSCSSINSIQRANKLQLRNSILKRQNQMLLNNLSNDN